MMLVSLATQGCCAVRGCGARAAASTPVQGGQARRFFSASRTLLEQDHYGVLGVARNASHDQVKKAYRTMAKKHHPDAAGKGSTDMFNKVSEAYKTLSDPQKRQVYDMSQASGAGFGSAGGASGPTPGAGDHYDARQQGFPGWNNMEFSYTGAGNANAGAAGANLGKMWDDIFGSGAATDSGAARSRVSKYQPKTGDDVTVKLNLGFVEAVEGCTKEVSYHYQDKCRPCKGTGSKDGAPVARCVVCGGRGKQSKSNGYYHVEQPCQACNGAGEVVRDICSSCHGKGTVKGRTTQQVNVPAGVDTKDRLRVAGKGEAGVRGGQNGHLYLDVNVQNDTVFTRDGEDVHLIHPLTLSEAVLGGKVAVPTLTGNTTVTVSAGVQEGSRVVLKGRGIKKPQKNVVGNMVVHFHVCIPTELSDKQRLAFEHFAADERSRDVSTLTTRQNMLKLKQNYRHMIKTKEQM